MHTEWHHCAMQMILWTLLLFASSREVNAEPCYLDVTSCVPISTSMCLTTKVTFTHTSLNFTNQTLTQSDILADLEVWKQLQGVPECWNVIQAHLCSVYLPKCDNDVVKVERPNRELCERVQGPCEVVKRYNGSWPWFLQCDQWFYAERCGQTVYETSNFDTSSECSAPLIETSLESNWYDKIKGCGVQCENPLYTTEEHRTAHIVVAVFAGVTILCTVFTLVTFILDWKTARKYPAVILFYINACFFIATLAWLAQFMSRHDVICRKDETVRKGEPLIGHGETASCTVVFILVYYFLMAGVVWFVMLAYSWDIHFKALGTVRDDLSKKTAYFHIISWCLPLVLTIVCLSISVIDADSLSGICFPGFYTSWVRICFVLVPIGLALVLGTFFSIRGLLTLVKVQKDSPPFIGERATAKIHDTIIRLGVFILLTIVLVILSTGIHIYSFVGDSGWNSSLMNYIYCKANVSVMEIFDGAAPSTCEMESRPSIVAAVIHIFAFFGAGLLFSSWAWNKASLEVWERLYRRLLNKPSNKPQKLRKHRMVARAFKRRKQRRNERLSISYGTDHDDPVGMRFDRSSASTHSLSSGFAVTIPKNRGRSTRGMTRPGTGRPKWKQADLDNVSLGSRISSSKRSSSRSSRRQSYESSMSQKLSDIEREIRAEERRKRRKKLKKKRQNRVQPILGPISSNMAAIQAHRLKQMQLNGRHVSDSSDVSRLSGQVMNLGINGKNDLIPMQSLVSSNVLSDSVTENSVSEIDLPQTKPILPDFSIFTTQAALPPSGIKDENKEENSNGNTSSLKGANPSPSGSYRRGRRREVKLEMTETSFYQEDEDNIEMGGNQTIVAEENCHETGEIRGNLKELGPLVNEIFEQARANSRNSGQRTPMGSSRLGSASSRGSKGSRGSQANSKDLKFATLKVKLPPEVPRNDTDKTERKRPFSGNYVLDARRNKAKRDEGVRKSQSQPGSRVSSAAGHKRQIGHNGKIDFGDGLSWSRFLHSKGHMPGQLFAPTNAPFNENQPKYYDNPILLDKEQRPFPGQLQIMDKSHLDNQNSTVNKQPTLDVLNLDEERAQHQAYLLQRPYTNPYRKYETRGDVLPDNPEEEEDSGISSRLSQTAQGVNILNVEAEHCSHCGAHKDYAQNVDVLNIQAEQSRAQNVDVLNIQAEQSRAKDVDVLDIQTEQSRAKNVNVLYVEDEKSRAKPEAVIKGPAKVSNISNLDTEKKKPSKTKGGRLGSPTVLNDSIKQATRKVIPKSAAQTSDQRKEKFGALNEIGAITDKDSSVLNVDQEHLVQAKQGDVLANIPVEKNNSVHHKTLYDPSVNQELTRPHTGPGLAKVEHHPIAGQSEAVSAFSGKGPKKTAVPSKTKKVASLGAVVTEGSSTAGSKHASNSVPLANLNVLNLEQQRQILKQKLGSQGSLSSGSRSGSRSNSRSTSANTGSGSSRNSRLRMKPQSENTPESELNKIYAENKMKNLKDQKPPKGIERNLGMFDFIDYEEFNSEYDDITTDDLTDTYTYTDYDDDLTEVSSLPC